MIRTKKNNNNQWKRKRHRVKMGFSSFKLLSKNIKTFRKKSNNSNNIKLKRMKTITPIMDHYPRNRQMGDTDPQSRYYLVPELY